MTREIVQLFGRPEARLDGRHAYLGATQVDRFLAYLAFRGTWVSRDELIFLFWPDQLDSSARRNLRKLLHRARQRADGIETEGDLVRWLVPTDVQVWHDALAATDWDEAVQLYRGPLFEGLDVGANQEFVDWVEQERVELRRGWREAILRKVRAVEADQPAQAARLLRHYLATDPLDVETVQACLRYLAAAGQQLEIDVVYHSYAQQLEQLGLEPPDEVNTLYRRLLEGPGPPSDAASAETPIPAAEPRSGLDPWNLGAFVGRDGELERLGQRLAKALAGHGEAVVVEGEAGVGKTRLIEEFLATAQGVEVFAGRCVERELGTPLEPIRSALSGLDGSDLPLRVDGTRFWTADPHDRSTIHQGLTARLVQAARSKRGAVLFVDDLQWGDPATLEFLSYAAKRVHGEPLLIVASYRREDRELLGDWLDHLVERRAVTIIRLGRLELRDTHELLGGMADIPAVDLGRLADFIHHESEGNPLYALEYLRWLHDSEVLELDASRRIRDVHYERMNASALPEGVRALVRVRFQALDETAQASLRLAAVIGRTFDFGLLEAASELTPISLWSTVEPLLASEIIVTASDEQYAFSHDKMRQAVYESIGPPVRRALHARVAAVLRERLAPAAELAHHYLRAKLWPEAFEHLDLVAGTAENDYAWEVALRAYTRILDIVDRLPDADRKRFGALQGLERLLEFMDRRPERVKVVEQMAALADRIGDARLEAEAQLKRMAVQVQLGDQAQADEARQLALRLFADVKDADAEALVYRELGYATWSKGDYLGALAASQASLEVYQRLGNRGAEAAVTQNIGRVHRWLANYDQALEWSTKAAAIYDELDDPLGTFLRLDGLAFSAMRRGNQQDAIPLLEQLLPICQRLGDKHLLIEKHMNLAQCLLGVGELTGALQHFQTAAQLGAETGDPRHEGLPLMSAGATSERLGNPGAAAEAYRRAARLLGTAYAVTGVTDERLARADALTLLAGVLARELEGGAEALEVFAEAEDIYREHGDHLRLSRLVMERAACHWRAGRLGLAEHDYRSAADRSREVGETAREVAALASLGVVRREQGQLGESIELGLEALELLAGLEDRQAEAYLLSSLAESYRRAARFADARASLERSLQLRHALGDHEGLHLVRQTLADLDRHEHGLS